MKIYCNKQYQSCSTMKGFKFLPDDRFLPLSKLKAPSDDNFNVAQMAQLFCDTLQKASFSDLSKGAIVWEWVNKICFEL